MTLMAKTNSDFHNGEYIREVYEDNTIIYTYSSHEHPDNDIVFEQDGYIFVVILDKIIKMDMTDYSIIEEKPMFEKYDLMTSVKANTWGGSAAWVCSLKEPVFSVRSKESIVRFDSSTLTFKNIIDKVPYGYAGYVQKFDNYLVIQSFDEVIIYNEKTNTHFKYKSTHYNVENGYIYLMTWDSGFEEPSSSNMIFKVKKLYLDNMAW